MPDTSPTLHLGKYIIHEELGRGGFGTVYRATDTTLDRVVALKILDPLLTRDPGVLERFRRDAIGAARLEHPNIVPVHEVGESEGRSFIAMKYLPGPSLDRLLAEDLLPVERTLHILAGLSRSGLCWQGLIHPRHQAQQYHGGTRWRERRPRSRDPDRLWPGAPAIRRTHLAGAGVGHTGIHGAGAA